MTLLLILSLAALIAAIVSLSRPSVVPVGVSVLLLAIIACLAYLPLGR